MAHRTRYCDVVAENAHNLHFFRFSNEDWAEFHNRMRLEKRIYERDVEIS